MAQQYRVVVWALHGAQPAGLAGQGCNDEQLIAERSPQVVIYEGAVAELAVTARRLWKQGEDSGQDTEYGGAHRSGAAILKLYYRTSAATIALHLAETHGCPDGWIGAPVGARSAAEESDVEERDDA